MGRAGERPTSIRHSAVPSAYVAGIGGRDRERRRCLLGTERGAHPTVIRLDASLPMDQPIRIGPAFSPRPLPLHRGVVLPEECEPDLQVAERGRIEAPFESLVHDLLRFVRAIGNQGPGDPGRVGEGGRHEPSRLAKLTQPSIQLSQVHQAPAEVVAGDEVVREGLHPLGEHGGRLLPVSGDQHVIGALGVKARGRGHPVAQREGSPGGRRRQRRLAYGVVGDAERGMGEGEVGVGLRGALVERNRARRVARQLPPVSQPEQLQRVR